MRAWLFMAFLACDGGKEPVAPKPAASLPEITAPPPAPAAPLRTSFPHVAKADRPALAAAIASQFPADWKPTVTVDVAGMPKEVVLELPQAPSDRVARALEIVRDHASLFGVTGALHHQLDGDMIRIGAGDRWSGQIVARFDSNRLTLYRHLWPVAVTKVVVKPEAEKLVAPFYGVRGEYRSRCLDCDDFDFVVDKSSFTFIGGMALVCTAERIDVRALIAIRREYKPGSRIAGIEKLPDYIDPETLAAVEVPPGGAVYFPGDGAFEAGQVQYTTAHGFDSFGCFE